MARQGRHGRFDAWVEIDGTRAKQYGDGVNGRTSTCFIVSRAHAELAVCVEEFPSMTSACARADVHVEGVRVGKAILSPSQGPCCFAGSWVDENSLRPFKFTSAQKLEGASASGCHISSGTGKIIVKISEVVVLRESKGLPSSLKQWQASPVIENDDDVERHSVVLAETVKWQKHDSQRHNTSFRSRPFDPSNPDPIVVFEFVYGSEEFILSGLGQLKSSGSHFSSTAVIRQTANAGPTQGTIKYGPPRKRSRDADTIGTRAQCWRCKEAGERCIPNGGASTTCQRCTRHRKGCNLLQVVQKETTKRQKLTNQNKGTELTAKSPGHNARATRGSEAPKGISVDSSESGYESGIKDSKKRGVEGHDVDDSSYSSSDDVPIPPSRSLRERSYSATATANEPKSRDWTSKVMKTLSPNRDEAKTSHKTDIRRSIDHTHRVETKASVRNPSPTKQTRTADASRVLQSIRTFSEELMQLAAHSEQEEIIVDVVLDLVNKCDSSSRRLQASILKNSGGKGGEVASKA